jgi:hypothetical protein
VDCFADNEHAIAFPAEFSAIDISDVQPLQEPAVFTEQISISAAVEDSAANASLHVRALDQMSCNDCSVDSGGIGVATTVTFAAQISDEQIDYSAVDGLAGVGLDIGPSAEDGFLTFEPVIAFSDEFSVGVVIISRSVWTLSVSGRPCSTAFGGIKNAKGALREMHVPWDPGGSN